MTDPRSAIEATLLGHGFVPRGSGPWVSAWTRKTLNLNRAVVLDTVPAGVDPVDFVRGKRQEWARAAGYVPFLYEVGLQVVLLGAAGGRPLEEALDRMNNQRFVVQSVFVVAGFSVVSARTWGQRVTGVWQDAIAGALGGAEPPPTLRAPAWGRALPWVAGVAIAAAVIRLVAGLLVAR